MCQMLLCDFLIIPVSFCVFEAIDLLHKADLDNLVGQYLICNYIFTSEHCSHLVV